MLALNHVVLQNTSYMAYFHVVLHENCLYPLCSKLTAPHCEYVDGIIA